jgi:hypothetical protein
VGVFVVTKPLKETVFNVGPDDALSAVDVYGDAAITQAATPKSLGGTGSSANAGNETGGSTGQDGTPVPPSDSGGGGGASGGGFGPVTPSLGGATPQATLPGSTPNEKLKNVNSNTLASAVLATGADEKQLRNKFETPLPKNAKASEVLTHLSDKTMGQINTSVGIVESNLKPDKYQNLLSIDLSTYAQAILDLLDAAGLNQLLCPGELTSGQHAIDGLLLGGWLIDLRKSITCNKGKPEIDLGVIAEVNLPTVSRSLVKGAVDQKAYGLIPEIMQKTSQKGVRFSKAFRQATITQLLTQYSLDKKTPGNQLKNKALEFNTALNAIDPQWQQYYRMGKPTSNMDVMKAANKEAKQVLTEDDETVHEAVVSGNWSLIKEGVKSLAAKKYPRLRL